MGSQAGVAVALHGRRDSRDRRGCPGHRDHPGRRARGRPNRDPRPDKAATDQAAGRRDSGDRTDRKCRGGDGDASRRRRRRRRPRPPRTRCLRRSPPTPPLDIGANALPGTAGQPHRAAEAGPQATAAAVRVFGSCLDHAHAWPGHQPIARVSRTPKCRHPLTRHLPSQFQNTQANFRMTTAMSVIPAMIATQAAAW